MGKSRILLTYDLRVGADYLKFKEELAGTFLGMRETRLLTTVVWDDADLDVGALTTYIRSHKDVVDFIAMKGLLLS